MTTPPAAVSGVVTRVVSTAAAAALSLSLAAVFAPRANADQTYYVPVSGSLVVHGHGYGHGHGMSQYGAQGAAIEGRGYRNIVNFYYPGTDWAAVKGRVRVLISGDRTSDLQVLPTAGLAVRDLTDGAHWTLPRGHGVDRWRLTPAKNGSTAVQLHISTGWHRWTSPDGRRTFKDGGQFHAAGPLSLLVPAGGDVVAKQYRGTLRLVRPYPDATVRDTVNVLSMDAYVRGVVPYEMPASWRPQALRAQAVAARTYAAWQRSQNPHRSYQICDTTACQVYGGVDAEQASTNSAVEATAGEILTYHGKPAFTQFSSSSGGWTAGGGVPYLPAKKDPYDGFDANPVHSWSVTLRAAALERAHPEIGRLVDLRVTQRDRHGAWHGRVEQIVLDGTTGMATLTGDDFRWQYGLRSTWFTIDATPIIWRWRKLGGAKSSLGTPTSREYAVHVGSEQEFQHGRIFWSSTTGAKDVTGAILRAYLTWGGPASKLRWPVTGMMPAHRGGHKLRFQHGEAFSSARTGAHLVYGAILTRYVKLAGASSWLGYPTADVAAVNGGLRGRFEHGGIAWDRKTGTYAMTRF